MAAGRVDVLRKRDFSGYRKGGDSDNYPYNNRSRCAVESSQVSDRVSLSYVSTRNPLGPNGRHLDTESKERAKVYHVTQVKGALVSKDGILAPPEKKRKFSPITWDDGKKALQTSTPHIVVNGALDMDVVEQHLVASQRKPVEDYRSGDDKEQGEVIEEEVDFVQSHNIESSRWASDSSSPSDDDTPKEQRIRSSSSSRTTRSSTPESGEICRDGSGTDFTRTSLEKINTRDDEYSEEFLDDDLMDTDKKDDQTPDVDQVESEDEEPSHRNLNMLDGCRSVSEFEKLNKISEGSYGIVYRARDKKTDEIVALKKVKMNMSSREYLELGFPLSALREINILLSFNHPSIVNVKEVVMGKDLDSVFMVMEYVENDLKGLMDKMKHKKHPRFSTSEIKCLMQQLLEGVKYLHDNWVLHRDLKTANLLFDNKGQLKICDFGISRQYGSPMKPYTALVVTLHYRAPEILLGAKKYSTAIDMWSVGCIMAELLANEPLFHGKTEPDQLQKIFKILGTPNEKIWPGYSSLPGAKAIFANQPYNRLRGKFPVTSFTGSPVLSDSGYDLLNKLLSYDPEKRITADDALNHEWFSEVPLPKDTEFMPTFPPQHISASDEIRLHGTAVDPVTGMHLFPFSILATWYSGL
ncbi:hypothetical protein ACFE04_027397 [Oxalis oulophora]